MVSNAIKELQSAKAQIAAQISGLEAESKQIDSALAALLGLGTVSTPQAVEAKPIKKSTMSAATIAKMRLAAKARWVQRKAAQGQAAASAVVAKPAKKIMSAAAKAKLSAF